MGPMGFHWVQKMGHHGKKNYHTRKFEFSTTPRSSISTKSRLYGYGAKSQWGLPRVHLGANGIIGSKKWVKTVKNYFALKFDYATTISTKIRLYGYGSNSRCRPPRVHFVDNGVPLGPKKGQNRKKNIRIFDYPAVIDFGQNSSLRLWRQIMVGTN